MGMQYLNTPTYYLASSTSSASITLQENDVANDYVIVHNTSSYPVFVVSGETAPTAAFPASGTVPVQGQICQANQDTVYKKHPAHKYISCISKSADATNGIYFSVGSGE